MKYRRRIFAGCRHGDVAKARRRECRHGEIERVNIALQVNDVDTRNGVACQVDQKQVVDEYNCRHAASCA